MDNPQRPTMRSRKLGTMLRELRESRGLTLQRAARLLSRTPSSLSKLETGKRGIRQPSLEHMLDRYELTDPDRRKALYDLARDSKKRGWWQRYEGKLDPATLDYISLESEAASIKSFQLHLVSGLLQTQRYIRAVIECDIAQGEMSDFDGLTEIRMRRQQILYEEKPPHFWAIVSEAALRQQFGGPEVMKEQLTHLLEVSKLPNVTLQILPFAIGGHAGLNGSFTALTTSDLSVVLIENLRTSLYLEDSDSIASYNMVFDHQRAAALSPSDSRTFIERLVSEL
ncbi:helix-turn-helix domain-containing protein [Spirillospora sp. NBC_00431]